MATPSPRAGRPRQYDLQPVPGFANQDAALAAAALDELSERLIDLIADLSQEAVDFVPEGGSNSIAILVLHMAWGEASWLARAAGATIPTDLEQRLAPGRQMPSGDLPPSSATVPELIDSCRRVRDQVTRPALASLSDIDREVPHPTRPMTVRGVLMHLIWHWTYHSGQVGLLRRLGARMRYQWTFDRQIGDAH